MKFLVLFICLSFGALASEKPNIILILADDHGYADLGSNSLSSDVKTPALDRLAREGVRFEQAYSTAPICNASRTGLIMGIHQARLGCFWYSNPGLKNKTTPTLAEMLKAQNYTTAYVGKIHYGSSSKDSIDFPLNHGFDSFFGFIGGRKHYLYHDDQVEAEFIKTQDEAQRSTENPVKGEGALQKFESLKKGSFWNGRELVVHEGFATEIFGEKAREFIVSSKDKPFYLQLAFNAVHNFTHQLPQDYLEKHQLNSVQDWDPKKEDYLTWYKKGRYPNNAQGREYYLGHLYYLDREVGKLLDCLEEQGIRDNTLVIYASDNGGSTPIYASNGPLRGSKYTLYEGGIRIPMIVSLPAKFGQAKTSNEIVSLLDLYPTICDLIGQDIPDYLEGISLLKSLKIASKNRTLFWHSGHETAMRQGKWKYKTATNNEDATLEMVELELGEFLYDLEADPGEQNNLIHKQVERAEAMRLQFEKWQASLPTK